MISAFNSLTLSPALAVLILQEKDAPKDRLSRFIERLFGWFFNWFNSKFKKGSKLYGSGVVKTINHKKAAFIVYAILLLATYGLFQWVPPGFIPIQDKQYLVSFAQLPEGATLDRTEKVIRQMSEIALKEPGVESAVAFPGLSINGFINNPSSGIVFVTLNPFDQRSSSDLSGAAITQKLQEKFSQIQDAVAVIFAPPAVQGLGTVGGFKLEIEDRGDLGYGALENSVKEVLQQAWQNPMLVGVFSSFKNNAPQLFVDIDRTKATQLGIDIQQIFDTLQIYLGSLYINDFNKFGRLYQVVAQADKEFRSKPDDILRLQIRNQEGKMVPLGSILRVRDDVGPETAMRYNAFRAADINGGPAPGYSIGQAQDAMIKILKNVLPKGMTFEWTELTYQQVLAGNTAIYVFPLCILLIYLVLSAKYESFFLPLVVILIVPLCLLFALAGVDFQKVILIFSRRLPFLY